MAYKLYMKRTNTSPWVKIDSYTDREIADRLADKYRRDYPHSKIEVIAE